MPRPPPPPNKGFAGGTAAARSAYFARREAAKVLRAVLAGAARRRAVGTIKSLVYAPSVRNKKATFALVVQTLKHLPVLKEVLEEAGVMTGKWKRQQELVYVATYDMLLGQKSALMEGEGSSVEKFLTAKRKDIQTSVAHLLVRRKVKHLDDLLSNHQIAAVARPRYARVNTLKLDVDSAIQELRKQYKVQKDDIVPHLLVMPAGTDLHDHPLVGNGSIFLQGKGSSMPASALSPKPGWQVLDACAAPGNKTVQLAALMNGKGTVLACELNEKRVRCLQDTIRRSGASNISVFQGDFLDINSMEPPFSEVRAILLDPSCSGSGTSTERLDHLLPSNIEDNDAEAVDCDRINKLAAFQRKALTHALSFPAVERVVYSTCSIHQMENEDVINSILPLAASLNFELVAPFPEWPHRGFPVFEGSERLLRTRQEDGMEGFFVALFVRKTENAALKSEPPNSQSTIRFEKPSSIKKCSSKGRRMMKTSLRYRHPCKMHVWLHLKMFGGIRRRKP